MKDRPDLCEAMDLYAKTLDPNPLSGSREESALLANGVLLADIALSLRKISDRL